MIKILRDLTCAYKDFILKFLFKLNNLGINCVKKKTMLKIKIFSLPKVMTPLKPCCRETPIVYHFPLRNDYFTRTTARTFRFPYKIHLVVRYTTPLPFTHINTFKLKHHFLNLYKKLYISFRKEFYST